MKRSLSISTILLTGLSILTVGYFISSADAQDNTGPEAIPLNDFGPSSSVIKDPHDPNRAYHIIVSGGDRPFVRINIDDNGDGVVDRFIQEDVSGYVRTMLEIVPHVRETNERLAAIEASLIELTTAVPQPPVSSGIPGDIDGDGDVDDSDMGVILANYTGPKTPGTLPSSTTTPTPTAKPKLQLNLNTATYEELLTIPGIGAVKAGTLIMERDTPFYKPFESWDDLMIRVKGVGPATIADIKASGAEIEVPDSNQP